MEEIYGLEPCPPSTFECPDESEIEEMKKAYEQAFAEYGHHGSRLHKVLVAETQAIEPPKRDELPAWIVGIFESEFVITSGESWSEKLSEEDRIFYEENIETTRSDAVTICQETAGQSTCQAWHNHRKLRISASKCHRIANARKPETRLNYLLEKSPNLSALRYGLEEEPRAREKFTATTGFEVAQVGLVISAQQPYLCGSPDGLFLDHSGELCLLEIKCPHRNKNQMINVDYIEKKGGESNLKKKHLYFSQVQLLMYLTNVKQCTFFVYSSADYVSINVKRDEEFL